MLSLFSCKRKDDFETGLIVSAFHCSMLGHHKLLCQYYFSTIQSSNKINMKKPDYIFPLWKNLIVAEENRFLEQSCAMKLNLLVNR